MNIILRNLPMISFLALGGLMSTSPAHSAGVNNVYYSASMCQPVNSTSDNAQNNLKFQYEEGINADTGPTVSGWYNYDNDNREVVVCPIPYDKFNTKKFIVARVVVRDASNDSDKTGRVVVKLCGQTAEGAMICPKSENEYAEITRGVATTGYGWVGTTTLSVNITPRFNQEDLRWFWLTVYLPDIDGNSPAAGQSGIMGYRILRCPQKGNSGLDSARPDCGGVE